MAEPYIAFLRAVNVGGRKAPMATVRELFAGLGLAVSRAIVEAHGGRIWLAEAPVGTRVRFTLPASA